MEMMMGISLTLMRQSMATAQTMNPMSLISVTPGLTFLMTSDAAYCQPITSWNCCSSI